MQTEEEIQKLKKENEIFLIEEQKEIEKLSDTEIEENIQNTQKMIKELNTEIAEKQNEMSDNIKLQNNQTIQRYQGILSLLNDEKIKRAAAASSTPVTTDYSSTAANGAANGDANDDANGDANGATDGVPAATNRVLTDATASTPTPPAATPTPPLPNVDYYYLTGKRKLVKVNVEDENIPEYLKDEKFKKYTFVYDASINIYPIKENDTIIYKAVKKIQTMLKSQFPFQTNYETNLKNPTENLILFCELDEKLQIQTEKLTKLKQDIKTIETNISPEYTFHIIVQNEKDNISVIYDKNDQSPFNNNVKEINDFINADKNKFNFNLNEDKTKDIYKKLLEELNTYYLGGVGRNRSNATVEPVYKSVDAQSALEDPVANGAEYNTINDINGGKAKTKKAKFTKKRKGKPRNKSSKQ